MERLLSREEFREGVFRRDTYKCVCCGAEAQDAHHLVERRLWPDGGYYLDNGASLCGPCHLQAEQTTLTCEAVRAAAGITRVLLPPHLYDDAAYDKWGNLLLPNGTRLQGELFGDESVQKILAQGGVLGQFIPYVRYPRTHHLPWSNPTKDDRISESLSAFEGQEVVVTVKMDGENTTLYRDYIHARSLDFLTGAGRSMVKSLHARIAHEIPEGWRLCGENLYAQHSIHYTGLPDYFLLFSVWNDRNECLAWDETEEWAALLGLKTVPVLYQGRWNEKLVRDVYQPEHDGSPMEGYVVRVARRFSYGEFRRVIGKYVKPNFVAGRHNYHRQFIANELMSVSGQD